MQVFIYLFVFALNLVLGVTLVINEDMSNFKKFFLAFDFFAAGVFSMLILSAAR